MRRRFHGNCLFRENRRGPELKTCFGDDGTLRAEFDCRDEYQGYDGRVHGGVLAAVLDAGMAQCLLGHGIVAYTARSTIRYLRPVAARGRLNLRCSIGESHYDKLYRVSGVIRQGAIRCVVANAAFYRADDQENPCSSG
jgi:acyl-coenzyme A thioesterase PaaI-like protein